MTAMPPKFCPVQTEQLSGRNVADVSIYLISIENSKVSSLSSTTCSH
ncbi:hypothetical protein LSAJ18_190021 [Latilactobacillus sakei]|nr:hypothetical protein LSAJ18_190021 [Latilactobacillus sakei]SOB43944.1 hypothetical protein LSAJ112_270018 [Latilactobacillus sakei]SON71761.1 protein of unknown function [Latilactobacillus sakei]